MLLSFQFFCFSVPSHFIVDCYFQSEWLLIEGKYQSLQLNLTLAVMKLLIVLNTFETESENNEECDFDVSSLAWSIAANGMRSIVLKKRRKIVDSSAR